MVQMVLLRIPPYKTTEHAGVGVVIQNTHLKYIAYVRPISPRIIKITFNSDALTLIGAYAPHAMRPYEEKDKFYNKLTDVYNHTTKAGPIITLGDFNARLQDPDGPEDDRVIGNTLSTATQSVGTTPATLHPAEHYYSNYATHST